MNRRRLLGIATASALCGGMSTPVASALASQAHGHTLPVASPATPDDGSALFRLLSHVPGAMVETDLPTELPWTFVDLRQQLEALGIPQEFGAEGDAPEGYIRAVLPLAVRNSMVDVAWFTDFTDAIGFMPLNVHTLLTVQASTSRLTLINGGIDLDSLPSTWERSGYLKQPTADGQDIWTIGGEMDFDFDHPIQGRMLALFNNATILDDGTVALAPTVEEITAVLALQRSGTGSAAELEIMANAPGALPGNTVSAMAALPDMFDVGHLDGGSRGEWADLLRESDDEVGPMPDFTSIAFAATAGLYAVSDGETAPEGADEGRVVVRIAASSPEDAVQAGEVVSHRWNTATSRSIQVPFADIMEVVSVTAEGATAAIEFRIVSSATFWKESLLNGDHFPYLFGQMPR